MGVAVFFLFFFCFFVFFYFILFIYLFIFFFFVYYVFQYLYCKICLNMRTINDFPYYILQFNGLDSYR